MRWLNVNIGTAAFDEASKTSLNENTSIIDVRDLVDKSGNDIQYITTKIEAAVLQLQLGKKVIICCDYGMSRSNSIAIGVLVRWLSISFEEAISIAKEVVDESGIKIEMLNTVYAALYPSDVPRDANENLVKNLLITGANGFLGKNLVRKLDPDFKISAPNSSQINLIENIIELDLYVKLNNIESIVHLANPRIFTNTRSIGDTLTMLKNVLDVCRTNRLKLIYLSGWEIYSGYRSEKLIANENLQPNPKGTYGETKWLSELLIKQYANIYGINYQIIRSGPVYGVSGEKPKFIYNFIEKALSDNKITTHKYTNGFPMLDLLYIDDLTEFMHRCISSDFVGDINIGTGIGISTFEIAMMIREILQSKSLIDHVSIDDYSSNIVMDNALANKLFSWAPAVGIKSGLKKILENYKL